MVSHMDAGLSWFDLSCEVPGIQMHEAGKFRKASSSFREVKVAVPKSNGIMVHKRTADKPLFLF